MEEKSKPDEELVDNVVPKAGLIGALGKDENNEVLVDVGLAGVLVFRLENRPDPPVVVPVVDPKSGLAVVFPKNEPPVVLLPNRPVPKMFNC